MTVLSIDSNAICFKSRLCSGVHQKIGTMYANLNDDKALWMQFPVCSPLLTLSKQVQPVEKKTKIRRPPLRLFFLEAIIQLMYPNVNHFYTDERSR